MPSLSGKMIGSSAGSGMDCESLLTVMMIATRSIGRACGDFALSITSRLTMAARLAGTGSSDFAPPFTDPTSIFEIVRWSHGTELLAAAVAHFDLFGILARKPMTFDGLTERLGL